MKKPTPSTKTKRTPSRRTTRPHAVDQLPRDAKHLVIQGLCEKWTLQRICDEVQARFGIKIGDSAISRWRSVSKKLLDQYRLAEFQVAHLLRETQDTDEAYRKLMTRSEEILQDALVLNEVKNPVALLSVRVQEASRKLREQELAWKREIESQKLELDRQRLEAQRKTLAERADEFLDLLFEYGHDKPELLQLIERHAAGFRKFVVKRDAERAG